MTASKQVAVLAYHRVGEPPPGSWETWFSISEEVFTRQLDVLASSGLAVLDATRFIEGLVDPGTLPERSALLTFDDGYATIEDAAFRALERRGWPAILFVPTAHVGGYNEWDAGSAEPRERICDWAQLKRLQRGGISVQAHGVVHVAFSELDDAGLQAEIQGSKRELEQNLEEPVDLLAFPYGDPGADSSATATILERAGFQAAFLYEGGATPMPPANTYAIARIPMGAETDLEVELGS